MVELSLKNNMNNNYSSPESRNSGICLCRPWREGRSSHLKCKYNRWCFPWWGRSAAGWNPSTIPLNPQTLLPSYVYMWVWVLVSPLSLTSVSSSSFRPSCQRVMSRCREKSQQALCSAVSFHWSNADSKLVPGSTSTCSTVNKISLLLTADLALIEEYWEVIGKVLTDGGGSSRQGGSGSLVHAVCWSLAFLWSLEVGVGVHTSRNHQLTICIHHLYARWDNQVLTDLSG